MVVRDLVCMWGSMLYFLQFVCLFFSSNFLVFCGGSGLGVYVGEQALLPRICLFVFSSIFFSFFVVVGDLVCMWGSMLC